MLVGTTSIETSEMLSEHLRKNKVPHEVLNAKHHEREAAIVAEVQRRDMADDLKRGPGGIREIEFLVQSLPRPTCPMPTCSARR